MGEKSPATAGSNYVFRVREGRNRIRAPAWSSGCTLLLKTNWYIKLKKNIQITEGSGLQILMSDSKLLSFRYKWNITFKWNITYSAVSLFLDLELKKNHKGTSAKYQTWVEISIFRRWLMCTYYLKKGRTISILRFTLISII